MKPSVDQIKQRNSTGCLKIKYIQSTKFNLKLIASINNIQPSLNSTQSNLNFEPSFVGIH